MRKMPPLLKLCSVSDRRLQPLPAIFDFNDLAPSRIVGVAILDRKMGILARSLSHEAVSDRYFLDRHREPGSTCSHGIGAIHRRRRIFVQQRRFAASEQAPAATRSDLQAPDREREAP